MELTSANEAVGAVVRFEFTGKKKKRPDSIQI